MKHLKSTLARRAKPFYYEIVGNGIIEFTNSTGGEADEVASTTKKAAAKNMLQKMLSNGAKSQPEIKAVFDDMHICSWRTVETAKSELGVEQFYGDNGISYWQL